MVQNEEFYQIADLLEHDLVKLKHGINQMSIREVHTLSETRELISRASDIDRRLRGKTFFEGLEYRSRLGQGIHDRCEAFLFADFDVDDEYDKVWSEHYFPIRLRGISVPEKVLKKERFGI